MPTAREKRGKADFSHLDSTHKICTCFKSKPFFHFFFFSQMETEVCLPLENVPFQALKVIKKFRRFTSWTHDSPPSPLESKTYFGICLFEICLLNLQQFHKLTTCGTVFLGANIYWFSWWNLPSVSRQQSMGVKLKTEFIHVRFKLRRRLVVLTTKQFWAVLDFPSVTPSSQTYRT